jgi:hypothetical protein
LFVSFVCLPPVFFLLLRLLTALFFVCSSIFLIYSSVEKGAAKESLDVRRGKEGNFVPGLTWRDVATYDDVIAVLAEGEGNRSTFSNNFNEHSSRSHLVVSIQVNGQNVATGKSLRGIVRSSSDVGDDAGAAHARARSTPPIGRLASLCSRCPYRYITLCADVTRTLAHAAPRPYHLCRPPRVKNT